VSDHCRLCLAATTTHDADPETLMPGTTLVVSYIEAGARRSVLGSLVAVDADHLRLRVVNFPERELAIDRDRVRRVMLTRAIVIGDAS
jgi:hypothetical protein